jgi:hypothetical protein
VSNLGYSGDFLRQFNTFDQETWQRWIESWLFGIGVDPRVEVYDGNLLEALVGLYRALPDSMIRKDFAEAVTTLLNTTLIDSSSASRLSTLIGLVSYSRPISGRAVVRKILSMNPDWLGGEQMSQIHLQALNAAGRYGLDAWLLRYVMERHTPDNLQHNLACYRILVEYNHVAESWALLDRIVPYVTDKPSESALRVELTYSVRRLGECVGLLRYAVERELEFELNEAWKAANVHFFSALRAVLRRCLSEYDLLGLVRSFPRDDMGVCVSFLAELHRVRLTNGSLLWDLEYVNSDPRLVVRGVLSRLTEGANSPLFRALQAALDDEQSVPNFDVEANYARLERFRERMVKGTVQ